MVLPLAALLALGQQTGQTIRTDFDPKKDMPHIGNDPHFINKGGTVGFCNGVQELTVAFLQVRQKNPTAFTMSEVSDIIAKYHGQAYLNQAMQAASNMAYDNGGITANLRKNPNTFVNDVVQRMQDTHQPQSVMLTQENGFPHQITVYGATKTDTGWALKVADVNHNDSAVADKVTLTIDKSGKLTSSVPGQPDETWKQGGVVPHPTVPADAYINLVYSAIAGEKNLDRPLVDINQIPKEALMMSKPDDPEVGGVLIRFDPRLFTGTIDEAKLNDLSSRMNSFLNSDKDSNALLYLQSSTKRVTLVPFASLSPSGSLGGLTRVKGFVVKPDGSTYLAGEIEPGKTPIPGEWLAVALQSLYAAGQSPFISLDPDPKTFTGPQHVRIGDIPDKLRSTSFIKAMLDADYLMKKINLDKEVPKFDGFQSWVDRMVEAKAESTVRMWFTPMSLPAADSYICRQNGGLAVLFESQVAVLSEQEKNEAETGFSGSGKDAVAEASAKDFTLHMDDFSRDYPDIYRLRGVFDVSKLAASWRALKVKPAGIDTWLSYTPPPTAIPNSYVGIGPELTKDGIHTVGGGAIADARFKPAAAVETDRLAPMLAVAGPAEVSIEMPATLSPTEATRAAFESQNLFATALSEVRSGFFEQGLADISKVLALNPSDEDAQFVQALSLGALKRYAEAIPIVDKLTSINPRLVAIRSVFEAASGDKAAAIKDADAVEVQFPANDAILTATTAARLVALDASGATKSLDRLRMVCPANPAIKPLDIQIDLLRFLGPEKARARQALQAQIPGPIAVALMQSPFSPGGIPAYKQILDMLDSGTYAVPSELYIRERVLLAMACAGLAQKPSDDDLKVIGAGVDKMIADHPDWPSVYLARFCVLMTINASAELCGGSLQKFGDLESKSDPLLPEILLTTRVTKLAPFLAAMGAIDPGDSSEVRHTMALLAADSSKGSPSEKFFAALYHNPKVDSGELQKAIDRGIIFSSEEETGKALDLMTATVQGIDSAEPAFLPALQYCGMSLVLVKPESIEFDNIRSRALILAAQKAPSRYLVPLAAKARAGIWGTVTTTLARSLMDPSTVEMKAVEAPALAMDRLLKPESKGDSLSSVSKSVDALVQSLGGLVTLLRSTVSKSVKAARAKCGDMTADAIQFSLAEMQQALNHSDDGDFAKLATLHPGIEKTPSFAAFKSLYQDMAAGLMLKEPEDVAWTRVLSGIQTQYDGLTVQALLEQLKSLGGDKQGRLAKYLAQCKLKTELGVSLSGN